MLNKGKDSLQNKKAAGLCINIDVVKNEYYYSDILKKLFTTDDPNIYDILFNDDQINKQSVPEYDSKANYSKMSESLTTEIEDNINKLNNYCLDVTMLDNYISHYNHGDKLPNMELEKVMSPRSRKKKALSDVKRDYECPFLNCVKCYMTRNSMNLHCKRQHTDKDILKENCEIPSPFRKNRRHINLEKVFKNIDPKELGYDHDKKLNTNLLDNLSSKKKTYSIDKIPTKKLKLECSKSMFDANTKPIKKAKLAVIKPKSLESSQGSIFSDENIKRDFFDGLGTHKEDQEKVWIHYDDVYNNYKQIETGRTSLNSIRDLELIKLQSDLFDATEKIDIQVDTCFSKKDIQSFEIFDNEAFDKNDTVDNDQIFNTDLNDSSLDDKYMFPDTYNDMFYAQDQLANLEFSKISYNRHKDLANFNPF